MKIKVLHVTGAMNRGGAEVMLMDIYKNISNDFHFDFLVNYKSKQGIIKGDFDDEIKLKGAKIKHIPTQWDIGPIKYIKNFKKICNELGMPDIVHIHMNAKSGIIALAAKKAGVKNIIVHSHADLKFRGGFVSRVASTFELSFQKMLISKFANYYWGCSKEANLSLFHKELLTEDKSAIINNAVDVKSFQNVPDDEVLKLRNTYGLDENTLVLGNIGRIVSHKNVLFVIDVLNELNKKGLDFKFVFAGRAEQQNYLDNIFEKAKEFNLTDKIKYLDVRDDVPVVVNSFDVFIAPALKEGFGLVAVEAQAAGLPCFLYKGFPKTVDMELGLVTFFDSFDAEKWANTILKNKQKNNDQKQIFNTIASRGFDINSNTKQIESLYKEMI
jgi:glycosyltransferase EpsF